MLLEAWCCFQYNYGQCINISTRSHPPEALGWTLTVMITESTSRILIGQLIPIMSSDWFQWWNYLWILDIITSVILYRLQQACHLVSFLHSLMINCIQTFLHQACHVIIVFLGLKICICSPTAHWQSKKIKKLKGKYMFTPHLGKTLRNRTRRGSHFVLWRIELGEYWNNEIHLLN